jgi:hypothetical protein
LLPRGCDEASDEWDATLFIQGISSVSMLRKELDCPVCHKGKIKAHNTGLGAPKIKLPLVTGLLLQPRLYCYGAMFDPAFQNFVNTEIIGR